MSDLEGLVVDRVRARAWPGTMPAAPRLDSSDLERLDLERFPAPAFQEQAGGPVAQEVIVSLSCGAAQFAPSWVPPGVVPHG